MKTPLQIILIMLLYAAGVSDEFKINDYGKGFGIRSWVFEIPDDLNDNEDMGLVWAFPKLGSDPSSTNSTVIKFAGAQSGTVVRFYIKAEGLQANDGMSYRYPLIIRII